MIRFLKWLVLSILQCVPALLFSVLLMQNVIIPNIFNHDLEGYIGVILFFYVCDYYSWMKIKVDKLFEAKEHL